VRFNLDPFDNYEDSEIIAVLGRVQLMDALRRSVAHESREKAAAEEAKTKEMEKKSRSKSRSKSGSNASLAEPLLAEGGGADWDTEAPATLDDSELLTFTLTEGGGNLSVGERQLLCLARALLRGCKVLVMDEATANVDPESDSKIQSIIREELSSATVLTVAHRLGTIIYYDRVMVLSGPVPGPAGRIEQFDSPANLLRQKDGAFYRMCLKTGDIETLIAQADKAAAEASRRGSSLM